MTGTTSAWLPDSTAQRTDAHPHHDALAERYADAMKRYVSASDEHVREDQELPALTVSDVMTTGVVTAYPRARFDEIARALHRNRINAVPVIDEDRQVVGIVTESDLLARVTSPVPAGHAVHESGTAAPRGRHESTAGELMSAPAITISAGAPVVEAARLFTRYRIRSLPVVDHAGALVAMVSRADLIRVLAEA